MFMQIAIFFKCCLLNLTFIAAAIQAIKCHFYMKNHSSCGNKKVSSISAESERYVLFQAKHLKQIKGKII